MRLFENNNNKTNDSSVRVTDLYGDKFRDGRFLRFSIQDFAQGARRPITAQKGTAMALGKTHAVCVLQPVGLMLLGRDTPQRM